MTVVRYVITGDCSAAKSYTFVVYDPEDKGRGGKDQSTGKLYSYSLVFLTSLKIEKQTEEIHLAM